MRSYGRLFDHEEFAWDEVYLDDDGLLHGDGAAPTLKTLLEWYLYGSLEAEYERETGTKPIVYDLIVACIIDAV